jgi:large subunit ribosomal protein L24|tara:strand:+ start:7234 stop:7554 length:321 start_codon:yes stop_codon:yes gene_type:complete
MTKKLQTHLKIGDKVKVITGSQKGIIGTISLINKKKESISIDNILPRITYKKNPQGGESQKVEIQSMLNISNVMLWDKEANNSSKIGYKVIDGKKTRYFKKSGNFV